MPGSSRQPRKRRCHQARQQLTVPTRGALAAEGASGSLNPSKMHKVKGDFPKCFPPAVEENQGGNGWDETQSRVVFIIPKPTLESWRRGQESGCSVILGQSGHLHERSEERRLPPSNIRQPGVLFLSVPRYN